MGPSYRPLIAVAAYHLANDRVARWPEGGYGVPAPYLEALRRAGARTTILPPGEQGDAEELLEPFDGLLLVGGGDIDPRRYGQAPGLELYAVEPDRDAFEISLVRTADSMKLPTLCICRGMQIMNVAFGGSLNQHLPGTPGLLEHGVPVAGTSTMHAVKSAAGSRLMGTTGVAELACSSHHHQGVERVGDGLVTVGWSDDGLVEAIERETDGVDRSTETWMLGVQWHPEDTAATDPAQQSLFQALRIIAGWRGTRAKPGETQGRNREYGIEDYDPAWPSWFEREADAIADALGETALRIEHVGSTAAPGLSAKPVIDVQVSVRSLIPRAPLMEPLGSLGFVHSIDPFDTFHEFLSRGYDDDHPYRVHVHVCESGSDWEIRHIAFRDWLRTHPDDRDAYAALKRRLAEEHPRDIVSYTDGKGPFIREIETKALDAAP